ncbi:MAG: hypothetical protein IJ514_07020 [Clostridia bacterium]|nr:hypothetical protein [Clostridia bacterium]
MKKLTFDIYIGKGMHQRQEENIVAFVVLPSDIPMGQVSVGGETIDNTIGFSLLDLLSNYIIDWLDLVEDENLIKANIRLNKQSPSRVFKGREIVRAIDIIAKENNRTCTCSINSVWEKIQ